MHLTDKELEIIRCLCKGYSDKEISKALFLSHHTVKWYIHRMLEKLELRDRTQLVIYAYENNIVLPENQS
jgi:DNA-binding NarL/FixJ family response regulator